jgi:NAD/FAD-utilizing enzyme apparently involved in cell division
MSCNPAIGGIAKGTLVREVDALGGVMGRATDLAALQYRMLNRSKGPAVWSPRAQCDRGLYRRAVRSLLEAQPNLEFLQGTVADLAVEGGRVRAVMTREGRRLGARSVILTAGTFLRGRIHLGLDTQIPAGRAGDAPAVEIAEALGREGLTIERFKTGTPPRIDGRSLDLSRFQRQDGETSLTGSRSSTDLIDFPSSRVIWLGRDLSSSTSFRNTCSSRRCTAVPSAGEGLATVRRSKTRSSSSPMRSGTRSSSSQRGWKLPSCM